MEIALSPDNQRSDMLNSQQINAILGKVVQIVALRALAAASAPRLNRTHGFICVVLFALSLEAGGQSLSINDEIKRTPNITGSVVDLQGDSELHLTERSSDPFPGSEIHLNSPDGWLFLTHVQPSQVASELLDRIHVSGVPAVLDENVRVVQHELGTVVIPHSRNMPVLHLYREEDFNGAALSMTSGEYHPGLPRTLRDWSNAISSFTLKRGYMATLAENSDGTGVSRVFIAQDGDLEVGKLPDDLNNRVSFIRVLPWRWVSKKGYAGGNELPGSEAGRVNAAWFYNWNINRNSSLDREYVAIQQTAVWPSYQGWIDKPEITHYMGYNEPDSPDQDASEFTPTPQSAIDQWPRMMEAGYRIGSPAVTDGGRNWLYQFIDLADERGYRVDYVVIHFYQWNRTAEQLRNWLRQVHERTGGRPIWLKEFNNGANWTSGPPTREENAQRIGEFIQMMDETPWIERYSVYSRVEPERWVFEHDGDGSLTPMGEVYRDQESPIGYLQEFPAVAGQRAHYRFDDNVRDSSGESVHAMRIGSPMFEPGVSGKALRLDGENSFLQLPANLGNNDQFSFAAWVKWDGGPLWQRIFSFGDAHNHDMSLLPNDGLNRMRFTLTTPGGGWNLYATALTPGEWTHVAVTIGDRRRPDHPPSGILYINGEEADRTEATIPPRQLNARYNYVGRNQAGRGSPLFSGTIDDLHIRNEVIPAEEIASLAAPPQPVPSFDEWAAQFDLPEHLSGPLADADGDGIPNGLEYLLGSDPLVAGSGRIPDPTIMSGAQLGSEADPEKSYLTLRVRLRRDASGVTLIPRAGVSLDNLSANAVRESEATVDDGDFTIHTFYHKTPIGTSPAGRGFIRLDIQSQSQ